MPKDKKIDTHALRCIKCDYLLKGFTTNRCPECGTVFNPSDCPACKGTGEQVKLRWWVCLLIVAWAILIWWSDPNLSRPKTMLVALAATGGAVCCLAWKIFWGGRGACKPCAGTGRRPGGMKHVR